MDEDEKFGDGECHGARKTTEAKISPVTVDPLAVPVAVYFMPIKLPVVEKLFPFHCTLRAGTDTGRAGEVTVKLVLPTTDMFSLN